MSEWKATEIGLIPAFWEVTTLEAIAEVITDGSHFSPKATSTGRYMASVKDMRYGGFNFSDCKLISEDDYLSLKKAGCSPNLGDVLISKDGNNCLDIIFVYSQQQQIVLLSSIAIVRLRKELYNPFFLTYFLLSPVAQEIMRSWFVSGTAVPRVVLKNFKKVPVPKIPLKEQDEIVTVVSCLDRKIENLRRQNETLEAIAQTLFKHWFVDFEFPNEDGKPYKSSGGAMERSELGEIPADWHFLQLGDVATNYSETHKFKNKSEVVFINTGDVLEGNFLHHDYSPIGTLPGQAKKKIRRNDILYSEIRPINKRFAYVNFSDNLDDYVVSTKFMVIRSNHKILSRLLYLILKRDSTLQEFQYIAESRSGTFPQITFESVSRLPIVIPEIMLQEKLMSVITPLLEKREFNIQKIETLTKTRDVLLPKLMSGQIRVGG